MTKITKNNLHYSSFEIQIYILKTYMDSISQYLREYTQSKFQTYKLRIQMHMFHYTYQHLIEILQIYHLSHGLFQLKCVYNDVHQWIQISFSSLWCYGHNECCCVNVYCVLKLKLSVYVYRNPYVCHFNGWRHVLWHDNPRVHDLSCSIIISSTKHILFIDGHLIRRLIYVSAMVMWIASIITCCIEVYSVYSGNVLQWSFRISFYLFWYVLQSFTV